MRTINNYILRLAAILLILVMFSTCIVTGRLAKYVTTASGGDSARVAKFELTESGVQKNAFYVPIKPGVVTVHTITVQNNSEVAMRYSVQMVNETNNIYGLKFNLTGKKSGGILTGNFDADSNIFTDDLAPDSDEVTVEIQTTWDNTDPQYAEMVDYVNIVITAEQID